MQQSVLTDMINNIGFAPDEVIFDGKIRRFGEKGQYEKKPGWYTADEYTIEAKTYFSCLYSDHRTGERFVWNSYDKRRGPKVKSEEFQKIIRERAALREAKEKERRAKAQVTAKRIWEASSPSGNSAYLKTKGLSGLYGARIKGESLVVPLLNIEGQITSLLFIKPNGEKKFLSGGQKSGCFFLIGGAPKEAVYIAEGFATGASIYESIKKPVLIAFDAGNLTHVGKEFRKKDRDLRIVFCADNDADPLSEKKENVGLKFAQKAAKESGGSVCCPSEAGLDFNDMFLKYGADKLRHEIRDITQDGGDEFKWDLMHGFFKTVFKSNFSVEEPDYNRLGQYFKKVLHFKHSDEASYIYEDNYYSKCGSAELNHLIDKLTKKQCKPWDIAGFDQKIKTACFSKSFKNNNTEGLLNLRNGILNVKTRELEPHNPKYFFRYKLDHNYDPSADSKLFRQFLFTSFKGDEQLTNLIGEIMGYTLMGGDPTAHRAFVFYGEGRNGKSTLLSTIRSLLGHSAVASVSLKNLDKPFSMVQLDGKLANIVDESPHKIDPEGFKNVVGGGYVTAAQKGKPEYDLKVNARLIFACNKMPNFGESGIAIKDRLIFVPFEKYIKEEDRDTGLEHKLKASREMSGILNFALDGLTRFLEHGFTKSKEIDRLKQEYEDESDPVLFWAIERLRYEVDFSKHMLTGDAFQDYLTFCRMNNINAVSLPQFGKRLKAALLTMVERNDPKANRDVLYKNNADGTGRGWYCFKIKKSFTNTGTVSEFKNRY